MSRPMTPIRVGLLLFVSGLAALVYQVAWLREFRLVFGASTAATAAVLAVFIGGLGAGAWLLGSRADRSARPLALYGVLELGTACLAALSPLLLWLVRTVYVEIGGSARLGLFAGTAFRIALSAFVLGGPTLLMGGAMPAAVAAVEVDEDVGRRRLAVLYGLNTLGAVVGCFLADFILLKALGTRKTLWSATVLGVCVGLGALVWSRRLPVLHSDRPADPPAPTGAAPRFVLFAAGVVGFAFFLMELVWYRMLGPLLGGTVFSFGIILALALLGIGLGSSLHGFSESRGRSPATLLGFAAICLAEAAVIALPFAIGDGVALLALFLLPLGGAFGFWGHATVWIVVSGLVVLPAAIVSGIQFPVLIALLGRGRAGVGHQTGQVYAANTVGAIAGSLAGGFGLIPLLTAPGCWQLVAGLLGLLGLFSCLLGFRRSERSASVRTTLPWLVAAAAIAVLLSARGPTAVWRHSPIAVGRVDPALLSNPTARRDWENGVRRSIAYDEDGVESSVALERATGYAFILNGKTDGHARMDAGTQVMGGLFGAFLHGHARRAFVIGLGTGSTSGWLAAVPSIERVDTVELEPAILQIARACAAVNHDAMENPKHRVMIGDAREALLARGESYDIIASEPSNPYRAGIASLFTREYYQAVERRLETGGIFLQWVQAYAIDGQTLRTIMATLAQVFPYVETWFMAPSDLLLVATREPLVHDVGVLRARAAEEPFRSAMLGAWSTTSLEGVFAHHVARPSLVRAIAELEGPRINTDDRALVEFGFARALASTRAIHVRDVTGLARARDEHRPWLTGGDLDWTRVVDERVAFDVSLGLSPSIPADSTNDQRARYAALSEWVSGRYAETLGSWRRQTSEPRNPAEILAVGDGLAETGDPGTLQMAEILQPLWPTVANGIRARYFYRRGAVEEADRFFAASLIAYRSDPWPPPNFMLRTLNLAVEAARGRPDVVRRLFGVLTVPFAVHMMDEARATALVSLAAALPPGPECRQALSFFEPNVPWKADFLSFRLKCYQSLGMGLADDARTDLSHFMRDNPAHFSPRLTESGPGK
ncbi:MAG: fused MFS/spermidine synthase [Polyangia bacterium]